MRAVCELLIAEYRPGKQRGVHDMWLWVYSLSMLHRKKKYKRKSCNDILGLQTTTYPWKHSDTSFIPSSADCTECPTKCSHHRTDTTFLSFSISLKVTVADILMDSTGSQADMSPLSTIATITLPWSIVVHDLLYKGPILRPPPIHLFLPHFQSSLPPRLIYNSTSLPLGLPSHILLISPSRPPFTSLPIFSLNSYVFSLDPYNISLLSTDPTSFSTHSFPSLHFPHLSQPHAFIVSSLHDPILFALAMFPSSL